jgi:hypothetical protein
VGTALVAAPERLRRVTRVEDTRLLRRIGFTDIALAPGLLPAPGRWRWLAARAAVNAAVGSRLLREPSWTARGAGLVLIALTMVDGRSAATLRAVAH